MKCNIKTIDNNYNFKVIEIDIMKVKMFYSALRTLTNVKYFHILKKSLISLKA